MRPIDCNNCGDCLACELREMRARAKRRKEAEAMTPYDRAQLEYRGRGAEVRRAERTEGRAGR